MLSGSASVHDFLPNIGTDFRNLQVFEYNLNLSYSCHNLNT